MLTLQTLKDWFEDIWNITVDLHISLNNAKRLAETKYEEEDHVKKHGFFQHHWYQLRFIMIIQLAKLLDDNSNQKRNFHKLCNCLSDLKYDDEIQKKLKENNIKAFSSVFKSRNDILVTVEIIRADLTNLKPLIDKVVAARDQIYAHKDPKAKVTLIKLNELEELINFCANVYNDIRGQLLDISTDFRFTGDWEIDYVLRGTSENLKEKLSRLKRKNED